MSRLGPSSRSATDIPSRPLSPASDSGLLASELFVSATAVSGLPRLAPLPSSGLRPRALVFSQQKPPSSSSLRLKPSIKPRAPPSLPFSLSLCQELPQAKHQATSTTFPPFLSAPSASHEHHLSSLPLCPKCQPRAPSPSLSLSRPLSKPPPFLSPPSPSLFAKASTKHHLLHLSLYQKLPASFARAHLLRAGKLSP